jgi:hypothetical protein
MARLPAIASAIFTPRLALNDRWVKSRWKPTVTPCPDTAYITTAMATSRHPNQPPQANGIAVRIARKGTAMNTVKMTRSLNDCWSPPSVP